MHDYDLNDSKRFYKVLDLEVPWAHSYTDMQPGKTDRERRENYRRAADSAGVGKRPNDPLWWVASVSRKRVGCSTWTTLPRRSSTPSAHGRSPGGSVQVH